MRLLVLGGNVFLGRAVAEHALAAGHDVTCAARGRSGSPPDGARFVPVDRDAPNGLSSLDGESFDAVVDVSRLPSQVRAALAGLAGRVGFWAFVSTGSVYADPGTPGQRVDTAPLLAPAPPGTDLPEEGDAAAEAYGRNKVACERAVVEAVGEERAFLCRAGLIVGPGDPTGRFEYWVRRLARGGEVLAPGRPEDPVQLIDVRDLAAWLVEAAQSGLAGPYDGIGSPMARFRFLEEVAEGVGGRPSFTWVDQEFLLANEVRPWAGERCLPVWLPLPEYEGFMGRDTSPSLAAGLRPRPLRDTARDTLAWLDGLTGPAPTSRYTVKPLTGGEEAELLRWWNRREI